MAELVLVENCIRFHGWFRAGLLEAHACLFLWRPWNPGGEGRS